MSIHKIVEVDSIWFANDTRNPRTVRVVRIVSFATGEQVKQSIVDPAHSMGVHDKVRVRNVVTGRETTVKRAHFTTDTRGFTLQATAQEVQEACV